MALPFKVHELLSSAELAELEAYAREPGRTVDECLEWMQIRGYEISRSAVHSWKKAFTLQLQRERINSSSSLAREFMAAAKEGGGEGGVKIQDAAILQLGSMVFESAATMADGGEVSTEDLANMALAMQRLSLSKARIEQVREEMKKAQLAAVAEGEKAAKAGASGVDVVAKVREILGLGHEAPERSPQAARIATTVGGAA